MSAAAFCSSCRTVVRVRDGRYVEHYVRGSRCPWSGEPVGGPPPAPPRPRSSGAQEAACRWAHGEVAEIDSRGLCAVCAGDLPDSCAHSSTMRLGDRRVCADCGEPRP